MADDWSWPHARALGDTTVKTPTFDRLVQEGVLFENAFVSSPSCTPSRFAIATGQYHWRLGSAADLGGSLKKGVPVYPELLQDKGYNIGFSRKGAAPSKHEFTGRDPFGERFKNFSTFFKARDAKKPFCYWYGAGEPHRPYPPGSGKKAGIDPDGIQVPKHLPDHPTARSDLADYYLKIQRFDRDCETIIKQIESSGELDNTIVIMTSDNGMPFPGSKATLYDAGTRVPLVIRWPSKAKGGRKVSDFTSLCDLAPTILEAVGLSVPNAMTGRSLLSVLESDAQGQIHTDRKHILTGMERHVYPWPARAIRNRDFLYIRNFTPLEWPTGERKGHNPTYDFTKTPWPTEKGAFSFNVDPSPSKQLMRHSRTSPDMATANKRMFKRRPQEELYDLRNDPNQLNNVAATSQYSKQKLFLSRQLERDLYASGDPRMSQHGHTTHLIEGWVVHVSNQLQQQDPEITKQALKLLKAQCLKVIDVLPAEPLVHLKTVPIWLTLPANGRRAGAEYHDSHRWLAANKLNTAKAKCVELSNAHKLEREIVRMPMLLLHELAHAYHSQVLGFGHKEIAKVYKRASENGSYDKVARKNSKPQKAYGMNNAKEYFAETTEAYFGENDFFPFNNKELKQHDPSMYELLGKVWEVTE